MKAVVNTQDKREQRVKNVFRVIMELDTLKGYMNQAQVYAAEGLRMGGETLKVQVMYVLCNTQYWRGDEARRCKKVLKEYGGVR